MRQLLLLIFSFFCFLIFSQNQSGDTITIGNRQFKLLGNNIISNPGYENDFSGWTDATTTAATLTSAKFSIAASGGINNSKYLIGLSNENSSSSGSIGTGWPLTSGKTYLFSFQTKYLSATAAAGSEIYLKASLTNDKTASAEPKVLINSSQVNGGGVWTHNYVYFTNTNPAYNFLMVRFRWLGNRLGFDDFMLHEAVEITKASVDNPLDMTGKIVNAGFNDNTTSGWTGAGTVNYHSVEFYQKTFNMNQTITGLPAGKYRLKAQGFERPKANDAGVAFKAGTETIYARLYASSTGFSDLNAPFNSLYKHTFTGTGSLNGYINTMAAAETMFTNNVNTYFEMSVPDILVDEGGSLTIGAKSDFQQNGYWTLFDNFRLEYMGPYDVTDLAKAIDNRVKEAQTLLNQKIQHAAVASLNAAIGYVQQRTSAIPLVEQDVKMARDTIDLAIKNGYISLNAYNSLQKAINDAQLILTFLEKADEKTRLQNAINDANSNYANLNLTLTQINTATTTLRNVLKTVGKQVYVPTWMMGDVYNATNNWSIERSKQSKNWILFWEPGFGNNPGSIVDDCLALAEKSFDYYTDSLKFIKRGSSKTDQYKMIIRLRFSTDWEASGSGVDNTIGLLTLTSWALTSRGGQTIAHEVGHCFQYQVHCDNNNNNGWMYGYGANASGGNGWWEQCAQWQAYKVFPTQQFSNEWFSGYMNNVHKHILHEAPRYQNFFIQDYWCDMHGKDFIGKLWNQSVSPEDPVETYKRITAKTQSKFNDEMWLCGAKFASWDIPSIKSAGASYISSRPQPKMNNQGNYVWRIDSTACLENYGHNIIKLNAPAVARKVTVYFEGLTGVGGFRKNYLNYGGWRIGFVALLKDGSRLYGPVNSIDMLTNAGKITVDFDCPANCDKLWLVVSGAPSVHWRHAWDDNDANDEQWPYQISFNNTNLSGYANVINSIDDIQDDALVVKVNGNSLSLEDISTINRVKIIDLQGRLIVDERVSGNSYQINLKPGLYLVAVSTGNGMVVRKVKI